MRPEDSLRALKGIGEKTAGLYEKLGLFTVSDLLGYYPRTYEQYEEPVTVRQTANRDSAAVRIVISSAVTVKHVRNLSLVNTQVTDENGDTLRVTWYRCDYLAKTLKKGNRYILRGRLKRTGASRFLEQPQVYTEEKYASLQATLQPVYALTAGLTSQAISRAVSQVLEAGVTLPENIPEDVRAKYDLTERNTALRLMHFPSGREAFLAARRRIVFEEFYRFLLGVRSLKEQRLAEKNHFAIRECRALCELEKALPYPLTGAQKRTIREISDDLTGHYMMNRLVQGDVGSGKTVIAFFAMLQTAYSGYQSALMAPTEVLARQHYQALSSMLEEYHLPFRAVLLTGSVKAAQRREAYKEIREGKALLVVGTHALIQEAVTFKCLALAVTDEQHRFGVKQRDALRGDILSPHVLVMSATPIPRTLALILYGDLDISVVDEMPAKRLPVKTCVVGTDYRQKAWNFIRNQVREGHQAYVICPLVEESELSEGMDVTNVCKNLQGYYGEEIKTGLLHGRMSSEKKTQVMEEFAAGQIQVLVSTTVVEVGIDVPNATVILIEDAQRFGLAQLHQLRGRVGRGAAQSYCILINTSGSGDASARLDVLNRSNDGFVIADEDLKQRGPGDFFGVRQSGDIPFLVADIYTDAAILKAAKEAVDSAADPISF